MTSRSVDLQIDVSEAAGLGEPATIAVTVSLPEPAMLAEPAIVCFAKPGGGYGRRYYTDDLPGPAKGSQADWHVDRGWIFVAVDHLGVGDSSTAHDPTRLDYVTVTAAAHSAEIAVLERLATGSIADGFPAVTDPIRLGIGQSMGGCLTVVQQARHQSYDGIGVLGYSAVHTHPPVAPGATPMIGAWFTRDNMLGPGMIVLNQNRVDSAEVIAHPDSWRDMAWGFHYDDVPPEVVEHDMVRGERVPSWASATMPLAVAMSCLTPYVIASEAAAVSCPVLLGMGERDVLVDPPGELRAYKSATSVDFYVCPRMAHMHNFAGTRELLWERIDVWSDWVRRQR